MRIFSRIVLPIVLVLTFSACRDENAWVPPPPKPKPAPVLTAAEQEEADVKPMLLELLASETANDPRTHCEQAPDLPRNRWLPGAAKARCGLLGEPPFALDALAAAIEDEAGRARVETAYRALLDASKADPAADTALHQAFRLFDGGDAAGPVAERWHELAPDSVFARTALGVQLAAAAVAARGSDWANETSKEAFAAMRRLATQATPHLQTVMSAEPGLTPACTGAIRLARFVGDDALMKQALTTCSEHAATSFWFVREMAWTADPRWGGSPEALQQVGKYAHDHWKENPILGALVGEPGRTLASMVEPWPPEEPTAGFAAVWLDVAREVPDPIVLGKAADQLQGPEISWPRLLLLSQAIRFAPNDANHRVARGLDLRRAERYDDAERDLAKALQLAPLRFEVVTFLEDLHARRAARPGEHRMADRTDWYRARIDCHAAIHRRDHAAADECTIALTEAAPDEPYGWYLRALELQGRDRAAERAALERYLALADPAQPSHAVLIPQARARLAP